MVDVAFSGFANAATPQSDTIALRQTSSSLKSASDNLCFQTYGCVIRPANYEKDLNAQAFKDDKLGEFIISSYPTEEKMVGKDDFLVDVARTVCNAKEVKRVMVIPNSEDGDAYDRLREILRKVDDDDKRITLFAMQPMPGGNFRQEILGYSLMNALGISANEIK